LSVRVRTVKNIDAIPVRAREQKLRFNYELPFLRIFTYIFTDDGARLCVVALAIPFVSVGVNDTKITKTVCIAMRAKGSRVLLDICLSQFFGTITAKK
jgi:hypothetical protein